MYARQVGGTPHDHPGKPLSREGHDC
jgi:hypothetical protein